MVADLGHYTRRHTMTPNEIFLKRLAVAEKLLGCPMDNYGSAPCPGRHRHTSVDGDRHFRILGLRSADPTPTCFHRNCHEEVAKFTDDFNAALMLAGANIWPWGEGEEEIESYPRRQPVPIDAAALSKAADGVLPEEPDMLAWLEQASPTECEGIHGYLQALYPDPESRILIFNNEQSQGQVLWGPDLERSWEEKIRLNSRLGVWFMIQPVDGHYREIQRLVTKHNPKGRSRRAHECISRFEYLLCESDVTDIQAWCRVLAQLPLPIVSITTSGKRSIHALIRVGAACRRDWETFRYDVEPLLLKYGADAGALKCGQLSRLPGCLRHGEKDKTSGEYAPFADGSHEQRLLWLNPAADGRSIIDACSL